jgi:NTE family protein
MQKKQVSLALIALCTVTAQASAAVLNPGGPLGGAPIPLPGPPHGPPSPVSLGVVALVLSGGGAKGAFEVGAVKYLYERGIRPDIICATSVGAVNAIKLAEGEGPPENPGDPPRGLAGLEAMWLKLHSNSDMYVPEPWFASLDPKLKAAIPPSLLAPDVDHAPGTTITAAPAGIHPHLGDVLYEAAEIYDWAVKGVGDAVDCYNLCQALSSIRNLSPPPRSFYNLGPVSAQMQRGLNLNLVQKWVGAGGKLRFVMVGLESGNLRYATELGQLLERDNTTVVCDLPAIATDDPACQSAKAALDQIDMQLAALGPPLAPDDPNYERWNNASADLQNQRNGALADYQACQTQHPPTLVRDLRVAVLASAAIPSVFVPVKIGTDNYVDGGIRSVLPIEAAVGLGATRIFAITDSKRGLERLPAGSFDASSLVDIAGRSLMGIAIDEILEDATVFAQGHNVDLKVIEATFDGVNDSITIHPGLILINMSYGYMRASDISTPTPVRPDRSFQLSDDITKLRRLLFDFERRVNDRGSPDQALSVPMLRWAKGLLSLLITERSRLGAATPTNASQSFLNWEVHFPWAPLAPSPYHAIGPVPADINVSDFFPTDGTLFQEEHGSAVYLILGGAKFAVGQPEFAALGLVASSIHQVPDGSLSLIPQIPWEGTLLKERDSVQIFWIQNGAKRLIRNFNNHQFQFSAVRIAPQYSLESIPSGPDLN